MGPNFKNRCFAAAVPEALESELMLDVRLFNCRSAPTGAAASATEVPEGELLTSAGVFMGYEALVAGAKDRKPDGRRSPPARARNSVRLGEAI